MKFLESGNNRRGNKAGKRPRNPARRQISPVLANVYLHYVLEHWYEMVLKKYAKGEIYYVRYVDDFLMMFQYEEEAIRVQELLKARLAKFGLEVAEDKTRIIPIGRFKGTKEDFDFLGFTFFNTKTRGANTAWESELAGHYNYYGVSGNFHAIQTFWKYVKYATYRMLNRRDQKGKFRYKRKKAPESLKDQGLKTYEGI